MSFFRQHYIKTSYFAHSVRIEQILCVFQAMLLLNLQYSLFFATVIAIDSLMLHMSVFRWKILKQGFEKTFLHIFYWTLEWFSLISTEIIIYPIVISLNDMNNTHLIQLFDRINSNPHSWTDQWIELINNTWGKTKPYKTIFKLKCFYNN